MDNELLKMTNIGRDLILCISCWLDVEMRAWPSVKSTIWLEKLLCLKRLWVLWCDWRVCQTGTEPAVLTVWNKRSWRSRHSPAGLLEHLDLWERESQRHVSVSLQYYGSTLGGSTALTWRQGRSGLDSTSPGPMMLKVASMCMGLGSLKEMMWIL